MLATLLAAFVLATTAPTSAPTTRPSVAITYDVPTDDALQSALTALDASARKPFDMTIEHTAVGLVDLLTGRVAMLRPDREEYAASVPKVGILLAYFTLHADAATTLDPAVRHDLGLMAKQSNNEMAAKFSRELGLKPIQKVLNDAGFYDAARGGGLWVGKHYGKGDERYGSPVGNNSHAATVRMLLKYFVMLEQDQLVSPAASQTMREIFRSPDLEPSDLFFVKALKDRPRLSLYRKWGLWEDWHHDAAVVTAPGRRYVLVALTRHPRGGEYLEALAKSVDDAMSEARETR